MLHKQILWVYASALAVAAPVAAQKATAPFIAFESDSTSAPAINIRSTYFKVHATFGAVALGSFGAALGIGAASGNLGKLMDASQCCPDGGARNQTLRTVDRALVTTGIISYSAAAAMAVNNLLFRDPPSHRPRVRHMSHRWLAVAHGAAFLTSAVTGVMMSQSQKTNPDRFARVARVHTASNVLLVPLLTAALSNILFE